MTLQLKNLQLDNQSPWQAGLYPGWSMDRRPQTTLVVKTGYWFDTRGRLTPMDEVPPIEEADRHYDDPLTSSLAAGNEAVPFKRGGELLGFGTAKPPDADARVMEVKLGLRREDSDFWHKTLRVTGPRSWKRGLLTAGPGEPGQLQPLPLRYESAYGGQDPRREDQRYEANPVGVGFSARSRLHPELRVPQIEHGPDYLRSPTQRPQPAGFGPLADHWSPRLERSPEIDPAAFDLGLCPFAEDLPPDHYNTAPADQQFDTPFRGNETLFLQGLVAGADPRGILATLPGEQPAAWQVASEREQSPLELVCDTLILRADERVITLLWRCALPQDASGWVVVKPPPQTMAPDNEPEKQELRA
jgi:hypothetical protein